MEIAVSVQAIFLNGTSSSGKTTLARALQAALPESWQHLALDQFRDGLPDKFRGLNAPEGTTGRLGDRKEASGARGALGDPPTETRMRCQRGGEQREHQLPQERPATPYPCEAKRFAGPDPHRPRW